MAELLVLGGPGAIYQPNAQPGFVDSAEGGVTVLLDLPLFPPPQQPLPAAEHVFRRIYITVIHAAGCAFYATPVVDGQKLTSLRRFFSRPAPAGGPERWTFVLALGRQPTDTNMAVGVRGTVLRLVIEATDPAAEWHLERPVVAFRPVRSAFGRGRAEA